MEQAVLEHHARHGDGVALEHGEIRNAQHAGAVLLQEHHLLGRAVQGPPLLHTPLQGALAPIPLLAGPDFLQVEQQGLGFKLRRLLEHGNQHAVPHLCKGIRTGSPVAHPLLLLTLGLQLTPIDALGAAH